MTNLIELSPTSGDETLSSKAAGQARGFNPATGQYTAGFGGWDNSGDVYNVFGGEVGGRVYPVDGLDIFANYALNLTDQQHAIPGTPDDQRTSHHKVNLGVQLRTKIGFNGEISFYYQSSQVWNEQVATLTGIVYQQFPLPAYTLLNGRLGWRFFKDRIEVSATVFNALAGVFSPPPQQHPFGNEIGRRTMGFFSYRCEHDDGNLLAPLRSSRCSSCPCSRSPRAAAASPPCSSRPTTRRAGLRASSAAP